MTLTNGKIRLGIVGCGAIGSRIALSTFKELKDSFMLSAIYDIDPHKTKILTQKFSSKIYISQNLNDLIAHSDIIVEAVNTSATGEIVLKVLRAGKTVLAMSVGRLFHAKKLFSLAEKTPGKLLLPSGAVAGIDAVKAAALSGIESITLTTTKPPAGFLGNPFVMKKGFLKKSMKKDVVLFKGKVDQAVKLFPQNINVAATIALAAGPKASFNVKIVASPKITRNTHEIFLQGAFGQIRTISENTVCPDNPKTSLLAVLSGIKALQDVVKHVNVGT